jgi:hypothetical protein
MPTLYRVSCPTCGYKKVCKKDIEAKHFRNAHVRELEHWECDYERIA